MRRATKGVTLIEAVLFTAVALGLIVGGLVFYQQASLARKTAEMSRLMTAISSETRALVARAPGILDELYETENRYDYLVDVLLASGAIPSSAVGECSDGTPCIVGPWGGVMDPYLSYSPDLRQPFLGYYIPITTLSSSELMPRAACVRLFVTDAQGHSRMGNGVAFFSFLGLADENADRYWNVQPGLATPAQYGEGPVTPADADVLCSIPRIGPAFRLFD